VGRLPGVVYRCRVEENYNYILDYVNQKTTDISGISPELLTRRRQNSVSFPFPERSLGTGEG
jgi:hypothetical protein